MKWCMKGFVNKDFKNKVRFDNDRMFCFDWHASTKLLAILNKEILWPIDKAAEVSKARHIKLSWNS